MKLNLYKREDIAVLEPVGKIMAGRDVAQLDEKLYALLGKDQKKVIIDLGKTIWVSSSTISTLLNHKIKLKERGGNLKLANLTNKIQEIVSITRLVSFFEVYDTLNAALDSFKKQVDVRTVIESA